MSSKSKHILKYPDLSSAMRPVPYSEEFLVPKSPKNLTFSDDNSDSDKDHGQQEGINVDCNPTFEAICSPCKPHILTQGDLKGTVRDLNLSKKASRTLSFQTKIVEFSAPTY